ncbi:HAMP domain-containing histidine kinase [Paenibacillus sp. E222]|uniref:HAMP domain-containing sensor histidine kinase n=1 Tax=Paenibacillus sp. E222 TaxID=2748863 RepID=UPI0015C64C5C|nr:HAMP domain-containing sensor histidine kinase [Paenibacillus sp. E222]QLG40486.1 HAMP domain-containing histidine kinase [Paenibacillus sp. E222]
MRDFFRKRISLTITLVMFVFGVLVATFLLLIGGGFLLQYLGVISLAPSPNQGLGERLLSILFLFGLCVLIGTSLTAFLSKKALNPIRKVIDSIHRVADGDFSVKVNLKGIGELEELSESFNKMTKELAGIETLRSDFINNFSHEFKTPIVSVRGFAKILKENPLSEEDRQEYLDIIIKESERLATLSTNVLTLAKYENLEILMDKNPFRLDEQIRRTIILMEPKWSVKAITINLKLEEVVYSGNEEVIQQIWINLLDNAIKFSHTDGLIEITLAIFNEEIHFSIQDHGVGMDEHTKAHLFDKFFQGDSSHAKKGYGLGLPLVKRIVELCQGDIIVNSEQGRGSKLTVVLYK